MKYDTRFNERCSGSDNPVIRAKWVLGHAMLDWEAWRLPTLCTADAILESKGYSRSKGWHNCAPAVRLMFGHENGHWLT